MPNKGTLGGYTRGLHQQVPGVQKSLILRGFLEAVLRWRRGRDSNPRPPGFPVLSTIGYRRAHVQHALLHGSTQVTLPLRTPITLSYAVNEKSTRRRK